MNDLRGETRAWYTDYYVRTGTDRNNIRKNPEVLFQTLANEKSVVHAARNIPLEPPDAKVLDVGCGAGGNFFQLFRLGYRPENLSGIDILQENLGEAKKYYPQVRLVCSDASCMPFKNNEFDLVSESTMFATLPDEDLAGRIAAEMLRVCRCGGYLQLIDWRTPKPRDRHYSALTKSRLRHWGLLRS